MCHKFLYSEELSGANYLPGSHLSRSTQTVVISSRYSAGSIQGFYHHRYSLKGYMIQHSKVAWETKVSKFTHGVAYITYTMQVKNKSINQYFNCLLRQVYSTCAIQQFH